MGTSAMKLGSGRFHGSIQGTTGGKDVQSQASPAEVLMMESGTQPGRYQIAWNPTLERTEGHTSRLKDSGNK